MQRRICTSMRNFYWPVAKASFRVGLTHDFALTDKLSIIPNVWLDGGVTGYCVLDLGQKTRRGADAELLN